MPTSQATLAMLVLLGPLVAAQDQRAPPARPPVSDGGTDAGGVGDDGGSGATSVPELLARTPAMACASGLLGADVLDLSGRDVGRLDDLLVRDDGRLVAVIAGEDGRLSGVDMADLIARAKPDPEHGHDCAAIRSFRMSRTSRRIGLAPEIEDKAALDAAWWERLDAHGTSAQPGQGASGDVPPAEPGERTGQQHTSAAPVERPAYLVLSALLERSAVDPEGRGLGTIADLVVSVAEARVAYLLVVPAAEPAGSATPRAVPFETLSSAPPGRGEAARLSLDAGTLASAPPVTDIHRLPAAPFADAKGKVKVTGTSSGLDTVPK